MSDFGELFAFQIKMPQLSQFEFNLTLVSCPNSFVAKFWIADIIVQGKSQCILWTLASSDNKQFCWLLPMSCKYDSLEVTGTIKTFNFAIPMPVRNGILGFIVGNLCGPLQWSSGASTNDASYSCIGTLSGETGFGQMLYAGQFCPLGDVRDIHGITKALIEPPALVSSILLLILNSTLVETSDEFGIPFLKSEVRKCFLPTSN